MRLLTIIILCAIMSSCSTAQNYIPCEEYPAYHMIDSNGNTKWICRGNFKEIYTTDTSTLREACCI